MNNYKIFKCHLQNNIEKYDNQIFTMIQTLQAKDIVALTSHTEINII